MIKYPEHEKLQAVQKKSQAIGEFIEWLRNTKQITFARWYKAELDEEETDKLMPEYPSTNKLLAEYFNIDLQKLEQEKRAMLDELREKNVSVHE